MNSVNTQHSQTCGYRVCRQSRAHRLRHAAHLWLTASDSDEVPTVDEDWTQTWVHAAMRPLHGSPATIGTFGNLTHNSRQHCSCFSSLSLHTQTWVNASTRTRTRRKMIYLTYTVMIHRVSLHLRRLIWSTQVISHNSPRRLEHCCTTNPRPSMTQPHHTGADGVALATRRISRQVQSVPTDAHGTHWPVRIWTYEYCDATPTLVSNQAAHNGSPSLVTIPSSASMVSPLPNLKHGTLCPSPSTTSPTLYILKEHWKLVILT